MKVFFRILLTGIAQSGQRRWCVRCIRYLSRRPRTQANRGHLCMPPSGRQTQCPHCSQVGHRCSYDRAPLQSQASSAVLRSAFSAARTIPLKQCWKQQLQLGKVRFSQFKPHDRRLLVLAADTSFLALHHNRHQVSNNRRR